MQKHIKLLHSPFEPSIEIVEDVVIKLSSPCSLNEVTVQINPNIIEYQEEQSLPGLKVRQTTATIQTDDTRLLKFDLQHNNTHKIKTSDKTLQFELINIGEEKIQEHNFLYFEFLVTTF